MTEQNFNEALEKVLKQPKYFKLTKAYIDYYDKFKQWLFEKIKEFIERFILKDSNLPQLSDNSLNVIMIIVIIISLAILTFLVFLIKKNIKKDVKIKKILGQLIR